MAQKTPIDYATSRVRSGRTTKKGAPILETLYFFYPDGIWDDHRRSKAEAEAAYPRNTYQWRRAKD